MRQTTLVVKLMGGFLLTALIGFLIGFVGWRAVSKITASLTELAGDHLPSIQNLLTLEGSVEGIRIAQRTLLNPNLDAEVRKRQPGNVAKAREIYKKAWESYESLPRGGEETSLWNEFVPALLALKTEDDEFFRLANELEKTGILDPLGFSRDLQKAAAEPLPAMAADRPTGANAREL